MKVDLFSECIRIGRYGHFAIIVAQQLASGGGRVFQVWYSSTSSSTTVVVVLLRVKVVLRVLDLVVLVVLPGSQSETRPTRLGLAG